MFRPEYDIFEFEGAKTLNGTIGASALSDQSSAGGDDPQKARITSNAHGLTITYTKKPLIYVQGLANSIYNGLRRYTAVATNTFDIVLRKPFAALTPGGTELWFVGASYPDPWEFLGFGLHLNAASATSENLIIAKDAAAGAAFDKKLYTQDMNTVQDLDWNRFDTPEPMDADDVVKFTWANTNTQPWGIKIFARRKA